MAAARGADRPRRHALGVAAGGADRPDPGRGAAVGRLGAGDRTGVQLHERHHPPLLHGRAGARRSAPWSGIGAMSLWRRRSGRELAGRIAAAAACWSAPCGRTYCSTGRRLAAVAALGRAAGHHRRGLVLAGRHCPAGAPGSRWRRGARGWRWGCAAGPGAGRRAPAGGVRAGHRQHHAHRRDPERGAATAGVRRPARRPGRLPPGRGPAAASRRDGWADRAAGGGRRRRCARRHRRRGRRPRRDSAAQDRRARAGPADRAGPAGPAAGPLRLGGGAGGAGGLGGDTR